MTSLRCFFLGLGAAGLLLCPGVKADTYRWVDQQGNVHYSDQLPPEQATRPREKLNAQTRKKELIEGAKTPEQLAREKQLKQLRAEQERLLEEQRDRDLSLLRTYRSEDDLVLALQGKIKMIDSQIKLTASNRQRQEEILLGQQQRAAAIERQGQSIPKNLLDSMETTRRQKASYQDQITNLEAEKQAITVRFTKDIARFKALKSGQKEMGLSLAKREPLLAQEKSTADGNLLSAIACSIGTVCDRAWELTKAYVKDHATTPLITETERILQTANPVEDRDIALTVTRIAGKTEDILFLDVRCRSSSLGEELCAGAQVKEIRAGFRQYLEAGLKNPSGEASHGP